jgi:hypothetical protein
MDDISFTIDTSEIEKALVGMSENLAGGIVREALEEAGEVMLDAIRDLAPVRIDERTPNSTSLPPGILKEDIHLAVIVKPGRIPKVVIGPTDIAKHVLYWIENGFDHVEFSGNRVARRRNSTRNLDSKRVGYGGKFVRHIEGRHFVAAGFDESNEAAVQTLIDKLGQIIFGRSDNSLEGIGMEENYGGEYY